MWRGPREELAPQVVFDNVRCGLTTSGDPNSDMTIIRFDFDNESS